MWMVVPPPLLVEISTSSMCASISCRPRPGEAHKRGRGLQLIEAHMDEVEIQTTRDGGTTIHMAKVEKKNG